MVQRERAVHLPLVVLDPPGRFVVDDQLDALLVGVAGQRREVVVGIGFRERERVAVLDPVAVPAHIPAFDQHAAQPVCGREIDIAFRVRRRGAVFGPGAPRHRADVHAPPDAHILHRLDPARVLNDARRIEVQAEQGRRQIGRAVGQLDGAPRRHERGPPPDLDPVGVGRQRRAQRTRLHAGPAQEHARVVHQVRLVNHDERAAVPRLQRERCLHAVEHAHRRGREQHLGAVEARAVRGDPPGTRVISEREFRELVGDRELAESGLLRKLVAEGDAVVERAECHHEPPARCGCLRDRDAQLAMIVAYPGHFAPRLGPRLIDRAARRIDHPQAVAQRRRPLKGEAETRGQQHGATIPVDAVREPAVPDFDRDPVPAIGGGHAGPVLGRRDARRQRAGDGQGQTSSEMPQPRGHCDSPVRGLAVRHSRSYIAT